MAHRVDEVLWNDLLNGTAVVHLMGKNLKETADWLKSEYWEGKCTMPDVVLLQKLEAAKIKGSLRRHRVHAVLKKELRTLQPHERIALERKVNRKVQHAERKARRALAQQARFTPATASTLTSSSVQDQIEQCWGEHTTDQDMRYPAAS